MKPRASCLRTVLKLQLLQFILRKFVQYNLNWGEEGGMWGKKHKYSLPYRTSQAGTLIMLLSGKGLHILREITLTV